MPLFPAASLFSIRNVGHAEGMPAWANLRLKRNDLETTSLAALAGPGLYGVFFDGHLIYIGLYAGLNTDPFSGSVLERWSKHIVGQTLRARDLFFRPRPLQDILRLSNDPAHGLAQTLPTGHNTIVAQAGPARCPPLQTRAILSSFNKAWFATQHWDVLVDRT